MSTKDNKGKVIPLREFASMLFSMKLNAILDVYEGNKNPDENPEIDKIMTSCDAETLKALKRYYKAITGDYSFTQKEINSIMKNNKS